MGGRMGAASPVDRLNREWDARVAHRTHRFGALGVWRAVDLLDHVRAVRGEQQDAMLHSLLVSARHGDEFAERVVLQALVPHASRVAYRIRALDDLEAIDRSGCAVSAAWEVVHCYPLHRSQHVLANMLGEVAALLAPDRTGNQRHVADRTVLMSTDDLVAVAGAASPEQVSAEERLARLLAWVERTRVVTRDEVALLRRATLSGEPMADIAAQCGVSGAAIRKRVDRIRGRIAAAAVPASVP